VPSPAVGPALRHVIFALRVVHCSPSQRCPTPFRTTIVLRSWSEPQIADNSKR
jgi:hypothetical protein